MAQVTTSAPATYKQSSRKGTKAWRKNVDLSEVLQGLDEVRDEIIKGGVIAEKDSTELFATDTTGDLTIARREQGKKLLKADEILALRSAVPGLDRRKRKLEESNAQGVSKKQKNGTFVPHKDLQRLKNVAAGVSLEDAIDEHAVNHDPWAEPKEEKQQQPQLPFLEETKPPKIPKTLKQPPKSLAENAKRIANVRRPDAGKSYNPLFGDWSALLEREGAEVVQKERDRLDAETLAAEKEARAIAEAAKVEAKEKDEYATDIDSAWESEWDGFQSEQEEVFTTKPKARKTPAERNKIKARKEREARETWERKQKEREAQEKKIREIAKEISFRDRSKRAHAIPLRSGSDSSDAEGNDAVQLRRRRFGKIPIPEAPLEVVLPDELEDSLRRLKPEGNLMEERYRNLLISGKVEPRKKQWQRKQAKTDRTEKWSYKDWKLK